MLNALWVFSNNIEGKCCEKKYKHSDLLGFHLYAHIAQILSQGLALILPFLCLGTFRIFPICSAFASIEMIIFVLQHVHEFTYVEISLQPWDYIDYGE